MLSVLELAVILVEEALNTVEIEAEVVDVVAKLWWKIEKWEVVTDGQLLEPSDDLPVSDE